LLTLGDEPLSFTLYLRETKESISNIKKIALAVSDPKSEHYGEFVGDPQKLATPTSSLAEVQDWLANYDIRITSIVGSRIEIAATQAQAEKLFSTSFSTLVNSGMTVIRAGAYVLPDSIEAKLGAVFGLHGLPLPQAGPPPPHPAQPAAVTPSVLISTYKVQPLSKRVLPEIDFFSAAALSLVLCPC